MSLGLEVLNRIDVGNDPVNWVDPWGLDGYSAGTWGKSKIKNKDYQYWDKHPEARGRSGKYFDGRFSPKCNMFVNDALDSGGNPPGRDKNGVIPSAGAWENPNSKIPGYRPLPAGSSPQIGDVVADKGHVGIYYPLPSGGDGTISASTLTEQIEHNDWGFRPGDTPTIWRCECDNIAP